jgi:hypothetical protein
LSQVRIFIEHAIGGMKRYNILVQVFRNRKADFEDDAIGICAGLWNFALSYSLLSAKFERLDDLESRAQADLDNICETFNVERRSRKFEKWRTTP